MGIELGDHRQDVGLSHAPAPTRAATGQHRRCLSLSIVQYSEPDTPLPHNRIQPPLRTDPELGRVCVCLYQAAEFRLYVIARDLTRQAGGSGKVGRDRLRETLALYGIDLQQKALQPAIEGRRRAFLATDDQTPIHHQSRPFSGDPGAKAPEYFTTNRPGVRDVYLSPTGSLEQWEATIYAGWMTHRENPTISRAALEKLFNRSSDTLQALGARPARTTGDDQSQLCPVPRSHRRVLSLPAGTQPTLPCQRLAQRPAGAASASVLATTQQLPNKSHQAASPQRPSLQSAKGSQREP